MMSGKNKQLAKQYSAIIKRKGLNKSEGRTLIMYSELCKSGLHLDTRTKQKDNFEKILSNVYDMFINEPYQPAVISIANEIYFKQTFGAKHFIITYFSILTGLDYEIVEKHIKLLESKFVEIFFMKVFNIDIILSTEFAVKNHVTYGVLKPLTKEEFNNIINRKTISSTLIKTHKDIYVEKMIPNPEIKLPLFDRIKIVFKRYLKI